MRRRHPIGKRIAAVFCTAAAGTGLLVYALPQMDTLVVGMTMASAAMAVPDGTVAVLRERFAQELLEASSQEEPAPDTEPASEAAESSSEEEVSSTAEEEASLPSGEDVPPEHRGKIQEMHFGKPSGSSYIPVGAGFLRNTTKLSREKVKEHLTKPLEMVLKETDEPQVLIVHTHATESYAPCDVEFYDKRNASWRSRDESKNVVALGRILVEELAEAGITAIQDTTQHDYPSYKGSYERSAETVKTHLARHPGIKVVIDVHRDAIQREDGTVMKVISEINGEKTAQVMIITGCDDDGTMGVPKWDQNLRFAASLQDHMEGACPGLTRPIFFCYRKYNQDLTQGSLLLEFGSHGNTLEECKRTAHAVGKALAATLKQQMQ